MRLTRSRLLPAFARAFGLSAGLVLSAACTLVDGGPPILLTMDPAEGVPGTTVTLTGANLGSPDADTELELHFGDFVLTFVESEEVSEWGPRRIVFSVPMSVSSGEAEVWVRTGEGETDRLAFDVRAPGAQVARDFVGAVVLADRESVAFLRMQKIPPSAEWPWPVLRLEDWAPGRAVTEAELGRPDYTTRIHDLFVETEGQATIALSRMPATDSTLDGEDLILVLKPDYVTPFTSYEAQVRPRRMAATGLGSARTREALVLGEGSAAVEFFGGASFQPRGLLSLAPIAFDARPDAAVALGGPGRFLLAGHEAFSGNSFLAVASREPDTARDEQYLQLLGDAQGYPELGRGLDRERVVDLATRGYNPFTESTDWNVTEIFAAYNGADDDAPAGVLMFRKTTTDTVTWQTGRLTMPDGERIVALDRFAATVTGTVVFDYLFVLVDAEDDDDDRLIQLHLGPATMPTFPASEADYSAWRAADIARGVTIDVGGTWVADVAAMEIRQIEVPGEDELRALRNPTGMSVLPVGEEEGPSFVLVSSEGAAGEGDFLAVVSTATYFDPAVPGAAFGEDAFDLPGTGAGAVACYRAPQD